MTKDTFWKDLEVAAEAQDSDALTELMRTAVHDGGNGEPLGLRYDAARSARKVSDAAEWGMGQETPYRISDVTSETHPTIWAALQAP